MPSIAVITSQAFSLGNFRGTLIQALIDRGFRVFALAPDFDGVSRARICQLGAEPISYRLSRAGMNPWGDLIHLLQFCRLLRNLAPDVTLSYFIKPVIYGSIAAWSARVPKRFSIIEGLGYVYCDASESLLWRRRLLRWTVSHLYRMALKCNEKVFFLNSDDITYFLDHNIVPDEKVVRLDGIGLDLDHYRMTPPVSKPITFVLIARMLREKGIQDFVKAARMVRMQNASVRFLLVGGTDPNPGSVTEEELRGWAEEGILEWTGHVDDVRPLIAQASVFVLPSYYREGVPRGNQEAMAMGRPVITTDWVGCRETVDNGRNGYLVPARQPEALAEAMMKFVSCPDLISRMGLESRRIAEKRFDVHAINHRIMKVMGV